ncbi:hypothetical protein [Pseudaeromonas pectinilytica]
MFSGDSDEVAPLFFSLCLGGLVVKLVRWHAFGALYLTIRKTNSLFECHQLLNGHSASLHFAGKPTSQSEKIELLVKSQ